MYFDTLQAELTLRVIARNTVSCPTCDPRTWLRGYASGSMAKRSKAAEDMGDAYELAVRRASGWVGLGRDVEKRE